MKIGKATLGAATLSLLEAAPAWANGEPSSMISVLSLAVIPLAIMFLTAIGGGYAILKQLRKVKGSRAGSGVANVVATIFGFILVAAWGGLGVLLGLLCFVIVGIERGVAMLRWGMSARKGGDRPAHLSRANPRRLIGAGAALAACMLPLAWVPFAFVSYFPVPQDVMEQEVVKATASLIASMRLEGERSGQARLPAPPQGAEGPEFDTWIKWGVRLELSADGKRFTLHIPPGATGGVLRRNLPLPPFNYLVIQPAYRADEAGRIRMVLSHHRDAVCPEDAPVVRQVSEDEVRAGREWLQQREADRKR